MKAQVGHLCVYTKQNSVGIFVPVFLWSEPGCLVEFLPISFEDMSWHIQRPVYSLFTAAALFYLDIPHKNSIELCSVGCSLAAFEDEIFAGVFSGQRPASQTVHMKQHHSSEHTRVFTVWGGWLLSLPDFEHQGAIYLNGFEYFMLKAFQKSYLLLLLW